MGRHAFIIPNKQVGGYDVWLGEGNTEYSANNCDTLEEAMEDAHWQAREQWGEDAEYVVTLDG